jgi:predicted patatin/cPLA2 family phospholipase
MEDIPLIDTVIDIDTNTNTTTNTGNTKPKINISLLYQYINALLVNVESKKLPKCVNLIFDSGAVNGLLGVGAALYINRLQEQNYIKVNKVSGCSIGSIIAVWYLCGCPDLIYDFLEDLFNHYKTTKNFFIYEKIIKDSIYKLFHNDDLSLLNNILHINYYDTKEHKQCIISNFSNREHLIECILRSSHIPYITSNVYKFNDRYIDGISPYIFEIQEKEKENGCKNIFIKLIDLHNPLKSLNVKNEKNIYTRLLKGVSETNDFFVNNNRTLCLHPTCFIKTQLYIRQLFVLFIILIIDYILIINNNLPECVKHCIFYNNIIGIGKDIWNYIIDILV